MNKIKKENILEELKSICSMENDFKELTHLNNEIAWDFGYRISCSIFLILFSVFLMLVPEVFLGMAFGLFSDFFQSPLWDFIFIIGIFSIASILIVVLEKENKKMISNFAEKLSSMNDRYNSNIEVGSRALSDFKLNVIQKTKSEFVKNFEKVDFALKGLRDEDNDFMAYSNLILEITEAVTKERKRRQNIRLEASNRLGESEEERYDLLKITES